jgi:hypothetical protein
MGDTKDLGRVPHGKVSIPDQSAGGSRLCLGRAGRGLIGLRAGLLGLPRASMTGAGSRGVRNTMNSERQQP